MGKILKMERETPHLIAFFVKKKHVEKRLKSDGCIAHA
jgi:hypothetical protein